MRKINLRYWFCQLLGWGGWTLLNIFIAYEFAREVFLTPDEKKHVFFFDVAIEFVWAIFATHMLRLILLRLNWIRFSFKKVVLMFIIGVGSVGFLQYYGAKETAHLTGNSLVEYINKENRRSAEKIEKEAGFANKDYYRSGNLQVGDSTGHKLAAKVKKLTGWQRDSNGVWKYEEQAKGREFWNYLFTFILCSLWLLIYLVWHYMEKNRKDQIDKLKLESTVKELELKTIKSHINPHFIFNSLNSIRALVDENPQRSRKAITELSNILRSSMQAEKSETVPLQKELDIVKDYLALEQMRFEERLKVEIRVGPDTLDQPVPPMMLQTLVENAVKHGISKQVNGGLVTIQAAMVSDHLELVVQNTGQLYAKPNGEGFGIKSTEDRLNLMYQGKATFMISNNKNNVVESKVILPAFINKQINT